MRMCVCLCVCAVRGTSAPRHEIVHNMAEHTNHFYRNLEIEPSSASEAREERRKPTNNTTKKNNSHTQDDFLRVNHSVLAPARGIIDGKLTTKMLLFGHFFRFFLVGTLRASCARQKGRDGVYMLEQGVWGGGVGARWGGGCVEGREGPH